MLESFGNSVFVFVGKLPRKVDMNKSSNYDIFSHGIHVVLGSAFLMV